MSFDTIIKGGNVVDGSGLPMRRADVGIKDGLITDIGRLSGAKETVKADGYLLIDTPNVDSWDFKALKRHHWGGYHFPRHWNLYTPKTIASLAAKTGFEVVEVSYYPAAVFWVWTMHSLLKRWPGLAARLFPPVEIYYRGTLWNTAVLTVFTALDYALMLVSGRCACMRILLRPK